MKTSVTSPAKSPADSPRYRFVILGVCWFAYMVAFMQRLGIGPLAPFLKQDLGLTGAELGLFTTACGAGYLISQVPAGRLTDRFGPRWVLLVGEVIGGVFLAGMFFVHSFAQGLILMALAGIGMGSLTPPTTKGIMEWFPTRQRATAMGVKQTSVNLAGVVTGAALPATALAFGWQHGFLGLGLIAIAVGLGSAILYRPPPGVPDAARPVNITGPRPSIRGVLKERDIWVLIGAGFLMNAVEFAAMSYFVLYLKDNLMFTVIVAGFFFAVCQASGGVIKPIVGLASDRLMHGNRRGIYQILAATALVTSLVYVILPAGAPSWLILAVTVVFGAAIAGWGGIHLTMVGEIAGRELLGSVTGFSMVGVTLGTMAGPPIFGYIVDSTASYRPAWGFVAFAAALAFGLLFLLREDRRRM